MFSVSQHRAGHQDFPLVFGKPSEARDTRQGRINGDSNSDAPTGPHRRKGFAGQKRSWEAHHQAGAPPPSRRNSRNVHSERGHSVAQASQRSPFPSMSHAAAAAAAAAAASTSASASTSAAAAAAVSASDCAVGTMPWEIAYIANLERQQQQQQQQQEQWQQLDKSKIAQGSSVAGLGSTAHSAALMYMEDLLLVDGGGDSAAPPPVGSVGGGGGGVAGAGGRGGGDMAGVGRNRR